CSCARLTVPRVVACLRAGPQNDDPRQVREGQEAINRPDKRNQKIQQFDLPKSEGLFLQKPPVQPPARCAEAIELQHFFEAKTRVLADLHQLFPRITAMMAQHLIERTEKSR